MMDYQKELELFLDYYVSDQSSYIRDAVELDKSFHVINVPKLLAVSGLAESYVFRLKDSWNSWIAAKAQAVPEGFVLVPKEIPKSFDEGLYFYSNSISVVNEHSDGFIPMSDIDHSEIWKLVIEAQEPAND